MTYTVTPIGHVRSPFGEKAEAPRQAQTAEGISGRIEVLPAYEDALSDIEGFDRIWILFWFHEAGREEGRAPANKVLPPRSDTKRGVFATRSPHRPNPIGMSAVRLERVSGRTVFVRDLDLIDGTPVLDLKPYLPYADAFPAARAGWLEPRDPLPAWEVHLAPRAEEQLTWLADHGVPELRPRILSALALGPQPHAYRRIRKADDGDAFILAIKAWRARFAVHGNTLDVERVMSGYRGSELATGQTPPHDLHRAFVARFGA